MAYSKGVGIWINERLVFHKALLWNGQNYLGLQECKKFGSRRYIIHLLPFGRKQGEFQELSYCASLPNPMELLNLSIEDLDLKDSAIEAFYRIARRQGSRQDFIDMYYFLQRFSLEEVFDSFTQKHPSYSLFRALMSLTYFVDAEKFNMPTMFVDFDWEQCKSFILDKVKEYENNH